MTPALKTGRSVRLRRALPRHRLAEGAEGRISAVFSDPGPVLLVEFGRQAGGPPAQVLLSPDDLDQ